MSGAKTVPEDPGTLFRRLKIRGFRSIAVDGGVDVVLRSPTVFVGPNNAGKSNVVRCLTLVRKVCAALVKGVNTELVGENGVGDWKRAARFELKPEWSLSQADWWMRKPRLIEVILDIDVRELASAITSERALDTLDVRDGAVPVRVQITPGQAREYVSVSPRVKSGEWLYDFVEGRRAERLGAAGAVIHVGGEYALVSQSGYDKPLHRAGWAQSDVNYYFGAGVLIAQILSTSIVDISAFRVATGNEENDEALSTNGSDVLKLLEDMRDDGDRLLQWTQLRQWMSQRLEYILGEQSVGFEVAAGTVRLTLERHGQPLPNPLADLGAGTTQVVLLLAYLRMNRGIRRLVCLDEPENNLHSGAVTALMHDLLAEFSELQLLVCTHSTTLMDRIIPSSQAYMFRLDDNGESTAALISGAREKLALTGLLGLRMSDLFLANTVIWVEGPLDIVYYRELLAPWTTRLVEGRDYAFAFYGGALIKHVGVDNESTLVDVVKLCCRAVVIADRDLDPDDGLKPAVDRLMADVESLDSTNFLAVTTDPVREVENMVEPGALKEALVHLVGTSVEVDGSTVEFNLEKLTVGPEDRFFDAVGRDARAKHGPTTGDSLSRALVKRARRKKGDLPSTLLREGDGRIHPRPECQQWLRTLAAFIEGVNSGGDSV